MHLIRDADSRSCSYHILAVVIVGGGSRNCQISRQPDFRHTFTNPAVLSLWLNLHICIIYHFFYVNIMIQRPSTGLAPVFEPQCIVRRVRAIHSLNMVLIFFRSVPLNNTYPTRLQFKLDWLILLYTSLSAWSSNLSTRTLQSLIAILVECLP